MRHTRINGYLVMTSSEQTSSKTCSDGGFHHTIDWVESTTCTTHCERTTMNNLRAISLKHEAKTYYAFFVIRSTRFPLPSCFLLAAFIRDYIINRPAHQPGQRDSKYSSFYFLNTALEPKKAGHIQNNDLYDGSELCALHWHTGTCQQVSLG